MANSPEYPDLAYVVPHAYGIGRDGRAVQYIVIHYTAGAERSTSAEDGAAYDARRQDGTSCHYFHDQNSTVQCVLTYNRANSAFAKGNRLGIQHELCGTAQTREQWLDPASDGTLWRCARQAARDCRKYGIPARRLSVAETRAAWYGPIRPKGFVGHADVTLAYPEDGGDHMDPGVTFPWDVLLSRVEGYLKYGDNWNGDDMSDFTSADTNSWRQARRTEALLKDLPTVADSGTPAEVNAVHVRLNDIDAALEVIDGKIDALSTGGLDQAAFTAALLAALSDADVRAQLVGIINLAEDS